MQMWCQLTLNTTSIGIEIVNLDGNIYAYEEMQMQNVIALCQNIVKRYN